MLLCSRTHRCSAGPKEKGVALEGQPVGLRRAISSSPCQSSIAPLLLFQIEADRVDAVSLSRFCRAVIEHMPQVRPAARTGYFRALHALRCIAICFYRSRKRLVE